MASIGKGTKRAILALALAGTAGAAIYYTYTRLKKQRSDKAMTLEKSKEEETTVKEVVSPDASERHQSGDSTEVKTVQSSPASQTTPKTSVVQPTLTESELTESAGPGSISLSSSFVHVDTPPSSLGVSQSGPDTEPHVDTVKTVSTGKEERFKAKDENDIVVIEKEKTHSPPTSGERGAGDHAPVVGASATISAAKEVAKTTTESPDSKGVKTVSSESSKELIKQDAPKESLPASKPESEPPKVSPEVPKPDVKKEESRKSEEKEEQSSEEEEESE